MEVETETNGIQESFARRGLHLRQAIGCFAMAAPSFFVFNEVYMSVLTGRIGVSALFSETFLSNRLAFGLFWFGVLMAALGSCFLYFALRRRRIFCVSPDGIVVGRLGQIPWNNILHIERTSEATINKGDNLRLVLHDPIKLDRWTTSNNVVVPTQLCDWMSAKAERVIRDYHKAHGHSAGSR